MSSTEEEKYIAILKEIDETASISSENPFHVKIDLMQGASIALKEVGMDLLSYRIYIKAKQEVEDYNNSNK